MSCCAKIFVNLPIKKPPSKNSILRSVGADGCVYTEKQVVRQSIQQRFLDGGLPEIPPDFSASLIF